MQFLRWLIIWLLLASPVFAQLLTTGVGPGGAGGAVIPPCGTGVIDASTGCTLPPLGS